MQESHQYHFVQCLNENCNTYHLVSQSDLNLFSQDKDSIDFLLCDKCKVRLHTDHVVQCLSCKIILDFIPVLEDESPRNLYVEKCSHCGGTVEDEINILTNLFKEMYLT